MGRGSYFPKSHVEYESHFPAEDQSQGNIRRPQFFACHPSVHEPHVGTGTAEEAVMGCWPKQPITDLLELRLVAGLDGGYTNVAQLALSLMGFGRDLGPNLAAQRAELLAIAGAAPEDLLRDDAAAVIRRWPKVSTPCPPALLARPPLKCRHAPILRRATPCASIPRPRL